MSDQSYQGTPARVVDGSNLINIPGGGILSINGDATPAQSLSALAPGFVSNNGVGGHIVSYVDFVPAVPGPSAAGLVPNPGVAAPTDYLAADATFKPIPAPIPPPSNFQEGADPGGVVIFNAFAQTASVTIAVTGTYIITGYCTVTIAGSDCELQLKLNGVAIRNVGQGTVSLPGSGTNATVFIVFIATITATDIVSLEAMVVNNVANVTIADTHALQCLLVS